MRLSTEQQSAIDLCCDPRERIVGVTGGAGVGKSLVLGKAFEKMSVTHSAVLCAPTGRAARRISELTGFEAVTIHRLLGFPSPDEEGVPGQPKYNRRNPLPYNTVFIDESSMVDESLYSYIHDALPSRGLVRMFGDNNQLPPVEGRIAPFVQVLRDYSSIVLTKNYRSDDEIISNALRILRGSIPLRNKRFEIIYTDDIYNTVLEAGATFTSTNNQIIIPQKKGKFGTRVFNTDLQRRYNPHGPHLDLSRKEDDAVPLRVRVNDKYLWTKNDYCVNIFNGTIGKITKLDPEDGTLLLDDTVHIPARVKQYSQYHQSIIMYDPRTQIDLGYAITTHKSQGSEFDEVVYVAARAHMYMLNRRNFYTGITRAKHKVYIICDRAGMSASMRGYKA